jgi:hypothetical protein
MDRRPRRADRSPDGARVLVRSRQPFRRSPGRPDPVLDPTPRYLPRDALVSDALTVDGDRLPAEGAGARAVDDDLADGQLSAAELRALAVGWVVIEGGTPGAVPRLPPGSVQAAGGRDLTLVRLPGPLPHPPGLGTRRTLVIGAHVLPAILVLAAAVSVAVSVLLVAMSGKTPRGEAANLPVGSSGPPAEGLG